MSLLEEKANLIAANARGENPTVAVDPATIMAIISVIVQVVKLYRECQKTPSEAKTAMESPNWINRWRLRRIARQSLARSHSDESVSSIVNGVLKQGKDVTVEEVSQLYNEAQEAS